MFEKFYPTSVPTLEKLLSILIENEDKIDKKYELKKNISYNLQYLEYLDFTLKDRTKLTDVIRIMTIRSFVIIAIGVIEGLLYYILQKRGLHTKKKEELVTDKITTQHFKLLNTNDDTYYIKSQMFRKLQEDEQVPEEMTLDTMLKKVQNKKILGDDNNIYEKLNYLRKLRNTVHVHIIGDKLDTRYDTHYNKFDENELEMTKSIMHKLLSELQILSDKSAQQAFSYLMPKENKDI